MNGLEAIAKASKEGLRYKMPRQCWCEVRGQMGHDMRVLLEEGWEVEAPLKELWRCTECSSPCTVKDVKFGIKIALCSPKFTHYREVRD